MDELKIKVRVQKKNPYYKFTAIVSELNTSPNTTPVIELYDIKTGEEVYSSRYGLLCHSNSKFTKYERYFETVCDTLIISLKEGNSTNKITIDSDYSIEQEIIFVEKGK